MYTIAFSFLLSCSTKIEVQEYLFENRLVMFFLQFIVSVLFVYVPLEFCVWRILLHSFEIEQQFMP